MTKVTRGSLWQSRDAFFRIPRPGLPQDTLLSLRGALAKGKTVPGISLDFHAVIVLGDTPM